MKKTIQMLIALLIGCAVMSACSEKDDESNVVNPTPDPEPAKLTYTLTIKATKGENAGLSKALALIEGENGKYSLNATWKDGDLVSVSLVNGDTKTLVGTLTAQNSADNNTTLTNFDISNQDYTPQQGDNLLLEFLSPNYSSQNGTLDYIAANCDYATASTSIREVTADGKITANDVTFINQQAIVKFTLSSGGNVINATSLKVNDIIINLASATNEVFVAIPEADAKNISLTVEDGTDKYGFYKAGANFVNGKYYTVNVKKLLKTPCDLSSVSGYVVIPDGFVITGRLSGNHKISIADGATVTLKGVTIGVSDCAGITCEGDATIILDGRNSVSGSYGYPGIYIAKDKTLTIKGSGSLGAYGRYSGAGIGGGYEIPCGNIVIESGEITASGGESAAGIGSGYEASCGDIMINGGTVDASGGGNAAGIGSGFGPVASCGDITINGGNVTALSSPNHSSIRGAAGIGSGNSASCDDITISGGTINATGSDCGAGIGSGYYASCGDITITAGVYKVTAKKGSYGYKSIGKGVGGECGVVTIEDDVKVNEE